MAFLLNQCMIVNKAREVTAGKNDKTRKTKTT